MTTYTHSFVRVATVLTGSVAMLGSMLVAAPAFADYNDNSYNQGAGNVCTNRYDPFCIIKETNYLNNSPYNYQSYNSNYNNYSNYNQYDSSRYYYNPYQYQYSYNTPSYDYQYQYDYSYQYQYPSTYNNYSNYNTNYDSSYQDSRYYYPY